MKKHSSAYIQQLQDELAWVKISINNKFTSETQRIVLRNSLAMLMAKIQTEKNKTSSLENYTAIEKRSIL